MKTSIKITFAALITLLTACASGPSYKEYASSILPPSGENGRIYIYRTTAAGTAVQPDIRVNGEVVGSAVPQGFFYVDRPAGTYDIAASTEAERVLHMSLEAGQERYVRLEMKMGFFAGHVKPVLVDDSEGQDEIQKTKYTGEVATSDSGN